MKFRITEKDLIIFAAFCIFLLYLCAIAILNFYSFANYGSFHGLLPFKAFTLRFLPLTLGMFIISLIIIFTSVSSYIFSKDKNGSKLINLGEKEEKGYSRWAKPKEIKDDKGVMAIDPASDHIDGAGVPLLYDKDKIYIDNSQYHNLVIGTTGSGKSESIVKPMTKILAKNGQSVIITDPKGELYESTANELKRRGYNIVVLNFRSPQRGNSWNPLSLPYQYYKAGNVDKATELLDDVAQNILYDPGNKNDPFWEKSAADYFSGLATGLFMDAKEEEVNLNSISLMDTVGDERFGASRYINEYFKMKGESSSAYILASNTINAPNDTKGGITSTFKQKIRLFSSREKLSEMLSYSDFDMRKIGTEKTAVFMIIHDEKTTYHSLLTIFIKQVYETLVDVANQHGGKLPIRTNFILDEFANMPPLSDVDSMVSAARSRDIRMTFIIQNFAQLNDVYGQEVAQVIKGNCNNWIYLLSTEISALEEISKMCGEVKSKEKDKTASTPLITVTDLQKFKMGEALLMRSRKFPFRTKLKAEFETNWGEEDKTSAELPTRKERPLELFDIKTFVSEEKRKQMMENSENSPESGNPFGGGTFGGSPFGGGTFGGSPFGGGNPFASSMPSPFKPSPMNNVDIDKVMADIDKRLKELDEEEEREKKALEEKNNANKNEITENTNKEETRETVIEQPKFEQPKVEQPKAVIQPVEKPQSKPVVTADNNDKPKINVDVDSVIVNDNIVTDDEFFDDFFGE